MIESNLILDDFVVMPNHVHGVILFDNPQQSMTLKAGAAGSAPTIPQAANVARAELSANDDDLRKRTLGSVVRSFKSAATKTARDRSGNAHLQLWQRGYYEHVIRSEVALARVRDYVEQNPAKWAFDLENPDNWRRR